MRRADTNPDMQIRMHFGGATAVVLAIGQWLAPVTGWAQPVDSGRAAVFSQSIGPNDYAANMRVDRVVVELDRNGVPADGQSRVRFTVRLLTKDGAQATEDALVTIEASGGRLLLPGARTDELGPGARDLDRVIPGTQLKVIAGRGEFELLAPAEPMDVKVRVTAGREQASGTVHFLPEMRELLAVGLIEGVVHFGRGRERATRGCAQRGCV